MAIRTIYILARSSVVPAQIWSGRSDPSRYDQFVGLPIAKKTATKFSAKSREEQLPKGKRLTNAVPETDEAEANINSLWQTLSWHGYGEKDVPSLFGRDASEDRPISDEEVEGFILGGRLVRNEVEHAPDATG